MTLEPNPRNGWDSSADDHHYWLKARRGFLIDRHLGMWPDLLQGVPSYLFGLAPDLAGGLITFLGKVAPLVLLSKHIFTVYLHQDWWESIPSSGEKATHPFS